LLREDSVLIPAGRSGYFVRVEDILLITVDGNYTTVTTRDGRAHIVLNTLAEWEKRLPVDGFLRVGCAELINLREIQKIAPCGRSMLVELGSARLQVRLNRAASARLKQVMDRAFPPLL
jgi:DNA-binding LytR/AlgR family response regulator